MALFLLSSRVSGFRAGQIVAKVKQRSSTTFLEALYPTAAYEALSLSDTCPADQPAVTCMPYAVALTRPPSTDLIPMSL